MSRKKENRFARILGGVLRYVLATVSISIVYPLRIRYIRTSAGKNTIAPAMYRA